MTLDTVEPVRDARLAAKRTERVKGTLVLEENVALLEASLSDPRVNTALAIAALFDVDVIELCREITITIRRSGCGAPARIAASHSAQRRDRPESSYRRCDGSSRTRSHCGCRS